VKLPSDLPVLMNLLKFSDMTMLKELNEVVLQKMIHIITSQNVFEILQFCIEMNVEGKLKEKCWEIIKKMSKEELVETMLEMQLKQNVQFAKQLAQIQQQFQNQITQLKAEINKHKP